MELRACVGLGGLWRLGSPKPLNPKGTQSLRGVGVFGVWGSGFA